MLGRILLPVAQEERKMSRQRGDMQSSIVASFLLRHNVLVELADDDLRVGGRDSR